MIFKYVMLDHFYPIFFSVAIQHSDFLKMGRITSAGLVNFGDKLTVFGNSTSLGLSPDPKDKNVIMASYTAGMRNYKLPE